MNKNKQIKFGFILILCLVLGFFIGSMTATIRKDNNQIESETTPVPEPDESGESESPANVFPYQVHYITGWDRCLDQLRVDCDVAFLGDSITYKSNFFQEFPDLTICNLGVCSDNIKAIDYRVATLWTIMPEHVFLMIGINSLRNDTLDECIEDYKVLIDGIVGLWDFQLYIMSITPLSKNESGIDNPAPDIIASFNEAIAEIAENKGAIYVDLYSQVVDDSGYIKDVYTKDGLHLSDAAYEVWANMIRPYIY